MKRIKVKTQPELTRADVEALVKMICDCQNVANRMRLEMDRQIADVRSNYDAKIARVQELIEDNTESVVRWAELHRQEFGSSRSIEFLCAVVGFRLGQPKVEKTDRKATWADIAAAVAASELGELFTRVKPPELDKEALLKARNDLEAAWLRKHKLAIVQDEAFYIEPKADALEQGVSSVTSSTQGEA